LGPADVLAAFRALKSLYSARQDPDFDVSLVGGASPSKSSPAPPAAEPSTTGQDRSTPVPPPSQKPEPTTNGAGAGPSSQVPPSSASRRMQVAHHTCITARPPDGCLQITRARLR
jgi:hypothetical protein